MTFLFPGVVTFFLLYVLDLCFPSGILSLVFFLFKYVCLSVMRTSFVYGLSMNLYSRRYSPGLSPISVHLTTFPFFVFPSSFFHSIWFPGRVMTFSLVIVIPAGAINVTLPVIPSSTRRV